MPRSREDASAWAAETHMKHLMRADGAGATHELTEYCREAGLRFSVGFDLCEPVRESIIAVQEPLWVKAIRADGKDRKHSDVCEITDHVDLSTWPQGSRLIARRTKLKDGDQQSFAEPLRSVAPTDK